MGDIALNANFVREVNHPLARRRCILWHFTRCLLTDETHCNSNLQQCSLNTEIILIFGPQLTILQRGLSATAELLVNDIIDDLRTSGCGMHIDGQYAGCILYADDI